MRRAVTWTLLVGFLAGACGGDGDEEQRAPAPTAQGSATDELPAGFPDDFPLPQGRTIVYSLDADQGNVVFFRSDLTADEIQGFMATELPKAGWSLQACTTTEASPEPITAIVAQKGAFVGTVIVGYVPNPTFEGRFDFYVTLIETGGATLPPPGSPVAC